MLISIRTGYKLEEVAGRGDGYRPMACGNAETPRFLPYERVTDIDRRGSSAASADRGYAEQWVRRTGGQGRYRAEHDERAFSHAKLAIRR